jgi:uncharacterized protein YjbJ (UPF0337 family)
VGCLSTPCHQTVWAAQPDKKRAEGIADQAEGKLQNAVGGLKNAIRKL